jgi:hypothetical protein
MPSLFLPFLLVGHISVFLHLARSRICRLQGSSGRLVGKQKTLRFVSTSSISSGLVSSRLIRNGSYQNFQLDDWTSNNDRSYLPSPYKITRLLNGSLRLQGRSIRSPDPAYPMHNSIPDPPNHNGSIFDRNRSRSTQWTHWHSLAIARALQCC